VSTVKLKKPHGENKVGEVISVPFLKAKELVAKGIAEYPPQPTSGKSATGEAPMVRKSALDATEKRAGELEGENAQLKESLGAAARRIDELEKELAKAKKV
jgi:hypothetical protein